MRAICEAALEAARSLGASYADARLVDLKEETIGVRNGAVGRSRFWRERGLGLRVMIDGGWGFASLSEPEIGSPALIDSLARQAVRTAKASAIARHEPIRLSSIHEYEDTWCTPVLRDPFSVSLEERLELLFGIDEILRADPRIAVANSLLSFRRTKSYFASSLGSRIEQILVRSGGGYSAVAINEGECQIRSFPMSFGGQFQTGGYEVITSAQLLENAPRIRDEAIALTTADPCPSTVADLILMPTQLSLQIHESVGHPNEFDRVLGWEADFAGRSFNRPSNLGEFRYGSDLVNLVADNTMPNGLATRGYDDDGVPARRFHVVQNGRFTNFFTTRDTAPYLETRSNGCNRAEDWSQVAITRIPNLSLMPGDCSLDELIADTKDGVLMETNKSWSIDQLRLNFQFGCELAYEIKNGKRRRMLRNPNYQDMTPRFWRSCDAICNQDHWELIGVANCGKGQPAQTAEMSHGCSPARFRGVTIGVKS